MRSFKQFLKEDNTVSFLTDRDEIRQLLQKSFGGLEGDDYLIDENGGVELLKPTFQIDSLNEHNLIQNGLLKIKFTKAINFFINSHSLEYLYGCPDECEQFSIASNSVKTLKGGPKKVKHVYKVISFSRRSPLTSYEGIAEECITYRLFVTNIKSLHNIHKHIKKIDNLCEISNQVKRNLLGFLKIKGPFSLICGVYDGDPLWKAVKIVDKHLGHRDLLACQEELIENGLEEYAQL